MQSISKIKKMELIIQFFSYSLGRKIRKVVTFPFSEGFFPKKSWFLYVPTWIWGFTKRIFTLILNSSKNFRIVLKKILKLYRGTLTIQELMSFLIARPWRAIISFHLPNLYIYILQLWFFFYNLLNIIHYLYIFTTIISQPK